MASPLSFYRPTVRAGRKEKRRTEKCEKCQDVQNKWFTGVVKHWSPIGNKLKMKFDAVFGRGEFNKAYAKGEINYDWEGKCRFCGMKYHIMPCL